MVRVDIGKKVDYKTLETALIRAAEEVGWKAGVQDEFEKGYRLGSVEETQDYMSTIVYLRGRLFPAMQVRMHNKNLSDGFFIRTGFPFGVASEKRIRKYLNVVSANL